MLQDTESPTCSRCHGLMCPVPDGIGTQTTQLEQWEPTPPLPTFYCPSCGNYEDRVILANRRVQAGRPALTLVE